MWKVLEKVELDIVGGWSTGFVDVSIEALWSQTQAAFKMYFVMAQPGDRAFSFDCYLQNNVSRAVQQQQQQQQQQKPSCWPRTQERNPRITLANKPSG